MLIRNEDETENKILIPIVGDKCPNYPCWSKYWMTLSFPCRALTTKVVRMTSKILSHQRISSVHQFCFFGSDKDIMFNRCFAHFIDKTCLWASEYLIHIENSSWIRNTLDYYLGILACSSVAIANESWCYFPYLPCLKTDALSIMSIYVEPHCPSFEVVFIPWCS